MSELASTAKGVEDAYKLLLHIAQYSWGYETYGGFGSSTEVKAYEVDSEGDFPYTVEDASPSSTSGLVIHNREIRVLNEEDPSNEEADPEGLGAGDHQDCIGASCWMR